MNSGSCFELLGFDVLFDEAGKGYLLEVNASPSLYCDCKMDEELKPRLIKDVFEVLQGNFDNTVWEEGK